MNWITAPGASISADTCAGARRDEPFDPVDVHGKDVSSGRDDGNAVLEVDRVGPGGTRSADQLARVELYTSSVQAPFSVASRFPQRVRRARPGRDPQQPRTVRGQDRDSSARADRRDPAPVGGEPEQRVG